MAPNTSIAVLSLHKMLRDMQEKTVSESTPVLGDIVELVVGERSCTLLIAYP